MVRATRRRARRPLALALLVSATSLLGGCATLSESSTQTLTVMAFDTRDRPVPGMKCSVRNAMGDASFTTPSASVTVRRSPDELEIECQRGAEQARGTVVPRRDKLEQALLPFGWVGVSIDHLTGHLYSYPEVIRLRLGQHLRYEFSTEARAAGLIATLGEDTAVDTQGGPRRTQPLPAATALPARSAPQPTAPAPAPVPRRSAPLTW